jgi:hypothetical protein
MYSIVEILVCSMYIQHGIPKHHRLNIHEQNKYSWLMTVWLLVGLAKIHHCSCWEFRASIEEVAKMSDMVRAVVWVTYICEVYIQFVNKSCTMSDYICILCLSTWQWILAADWFFCVGSLPWSSWLSKVHLCLKASKTVLVDVLVLNWFKTFL